jgi:hypothetical protein
MIAAGPAANRPPHCWLAGAFRRSEVSFNRRVPEWL